MAIQKIEIVDNNKVGDCDLLAVHNPLVYTIKMTLDDTGDAYDDVIEVDVNISGNETEFLGTFNAPFLKQLNPNERLYIFNADEILRSGLNPIEDYEQDFNDKAATYDDVIDEYLAKGFYLTFRADASGTPIEVVETLTGVHAARDFENEYGANLVNICANESKIYVGAEGEESYAYDYSGNNTNWWYIELDEDVMADGTIITVQQPSYNSPALIRGGGLTTNPVTNIDVLIAFSMRLSAVGPNEVQIGANLNETHNNIIAYLSQYTPTIQNIEIRKPSGDTYYSIFFTDNTEWYIQYGFAYLTVFLDNYNDAADDGTNLHFDYTTSDGLITTEVRLTAKITPVLATDFEINSDYEILINNIRVAIATNYPAIADLVAYDGNYVVPNLFLIQEPNVREDSLGLGGFTVIDASAGASRTDPKVYDNTELNPLFKRKKILVDETNPFEVNMRNVNHVVWPKPFCDNALKIKYLDRNGQYRFMVGESRFKKRTNQKQIGTINRLVTSIKDNLGDEINVGFSNYNVITVKVTDLRNDRSFTMADNSIVTLDEIALLQDLYNSSDVQVFINNKYVSCVLSGDRLIKKSKGNSIDVKLTLELPKSYNITQL